MSNKAATDMVGGTLNGETIALRPPSALVWSCRLAGWLCLCGCNYTRISEVRNSSHALTTELVFLD